MLAALVMCDTRAMKCLWVMMVVAACGDNKTVEVPDAPPVCTGTRTVFLNRAGGMYVKQTAGDDDSTMNKSSIIDMDRTLPPPTIAAESDWTSFVDCVKSKFAPFNVTITDQDPGTADHVELVVLDSLQQIGFDANTISVSQFKCAPGTNAPSVFERAIPFMGWGPSNVSTGDRCWTAAQTVGSAYGLDHAFSCPDLMTFMTGCGASADKTFTDAEVDCGEFQARTCTCGPAKQNSFQYLTATLGEACP